MPKRIEWIPLPTPFWARGGHTQTILGHLLRGSRPPEGGRSVCLNLPDGDALALSVYERPSRNVVLLFHGLSGSSESGYIRRLARQCLDAGLTVVTVNHRGCGDGQQLPHRKPYHSGSSADLAEVIAWSRAAFPDQRQIAVGFSLSANALLLLLGTERNSERLPDSAIAVNAPIDLERASVLLTQGLNRIYDRHFTKQALRDIHRRWEEGWLESIPSPRKPTIREFDAVYTAPEAGFASRDEYYRTCSARRVAHEIRVPTRVLTAKDDPFVDYRDYLATDFSDSVRVSIAESGGHMGYLSRGEIWPLASHWLDQVIPEWIEQFTRPA